MTHQDIVRKSKEAYPDKDGLIRCLSTSELLEIQREAYVRGMEDSFLNDEKYQTVSVESLDRLNEKVKEYESLPSMDRWIAVGKDGIMRLFRGKPIDDSAIPKEYQHFFKPDPTVQKIPNELFPDAQPSDEPFKVKVLFKRYDTER